MLGVVSGGVAEDGERLAAASPGCRALHVDWPAWSGAGLGQRADLADLAERAGVASMPAQDGCRLLLKLLAAAHLPARLVGHGRLGAQGPRPPAIAGQTGRRPSGGRLAHE